MQFKKEHINFMKLIELFLGHKIYLNTSLIQKLLSRRICKTKILLTIRLRINGSTLFNDFKYGYECAIAYMKLFPFTLVPTWIKSSENVQADVLSFMYKLFPHETHLFTIFHLQNFFATGLQQIQHIVQLRRFHPAPRDFL